MFQVASWVHVHADVVETVNFPWAMGETGNIWIGIDRSGNSITKHSQKT